MPEFDAVLEPTDRGPGCGIRLPFDPKATWGRARAPVLVAIDGHDPFRTTTAVYSGVAWIGLRRDQLRAFDVSAGDRVQVRVDVDNAPREVEVPAELAAALAQAPAAAERYRELSYTHRTDYARWVGEAKRAQTRTTRATRAVEMLQAGIRSPR